MQKIHSLNPPVVAGICDPNKSQAWHHHSLKIPDSNDEENGRYKCGNINCDLCNVLYLSNEFQSTMTGTSYHINFKFDSNSINVIYLLPVKDIESNMLGP